MSEEDLEARARQLEAELRAARAQAEADKARHAEHVLALQAQAEADRGSREKLVASLQDALREKIEEGRALTKSLDQSTAMLAKMTERYESAAAQILAIRGTAALGEEAMPGVPHVDRDVAYGHAVWSPELEDVRAVRLALKESAGPNAFTLVRKHHRMGGDPLHRHKG